MAEICYAGKEYYVDIEKFHGNPGDCHGTVLVTHVGTDSRFVVSVTEGLQHYVKEYGEEFSVGIDSAFHKCMIAVNEPQKEVSYSFDDMMRGMSEEESKDI